MAADRSLHALAEDADLVSSARTGDRKAFDELYRRHSQSAWRLAQSVTRNAHDAAEATSEAFAKVFAKMEGGTYNTEAPFRPYLLTATRNAAIDSIRGRGREVTVDPPEIDLRPVPDAENHLMADTDAGLVREAYAALPERQRAVLWLIEVEGLKPREAAPILGLSPNATSQLAVRARAALRERYLQAHLTVAETRACKRVVSRLSQYLAGELPARDVSIIDQHLAGCDACRERASEAEEVRSRLSLIALPLPLGLAAASADKWAHTMAGAASTSGPALVIPGAANLTPFAQRALVGAAALFVGAGVLGVTLFGASDPSAGGQLARPPVETVADAPAQSDLELGADEAPSLTQPLADAASSLDENAASEGGSIVGDIARNTSEEFEPLPATSDDSTEAPSVPGLPEGPTGSNPPATDPPPSTSPGIETPLPVGIEASANLVVETVTINAGDCNGVDSCDSEPRSEPGVDATVETPLTDDVTISIP